MGGGGPKPTPKTGGTAAKPAPAAYQTMQPFMPGFDTALAQQLSMGYGGQPSDFLKQFASIYSPMQLPTSPVYLNPKPASPAPTGGGKNGGNKKFGLGWKQDLYDGKSS